MEETKINARIPKMARSLEKPDWQVFKRSQESHKLAWESMRAEWEKQYNFGKTYEIRRDAGEKLGYCEIRMAVHEFFRPLYWFHDKLL